MTTLVSCWPHPPLSTQRRRHAVAVLALTLLALGFAPPAFADLDLVVVIDTTGSMGGEIAEAKARVVELWASIRAARPGERVRLGVVAYRDRGEEYVTRVQALAEEVEAPLAFLNALVAAGGGDTPEDLLAGVAAALREAGWDDGAERMVVLVGDAPPHLDYDDGPDFEELIAEARRLEVAIHTLGCRSLSPEGVGFFRRLAYATEASYQHVGEVRAAEPALYAAVLKAVTPGAPPPGEPLGLAPVARRIGGAGPALLVRQGGTASDAQGGASALPGCVLEVRVPPGFALGAEPTLRLGDAGLDVGLALELDEAGSGSVDLFALERCLPLTTPIRVAVEG